MKRYWISTFNWVGAVDVKNGIIIRTPPILRMFNGRPLVQLEAWIKKCGGFQIEDLEEVQETRDEISRYIGVKHQ